MLIASTQESKVEPPMTTYELKIDTESEKKAKKKTKSLNKPCFVSSIFYYKFIARNAFTGGGE